MAQSKVGALEGRELADDYVRTSVPESRWGESWDTFKSAFGKFVFVNVLVLVFCVPMIAVLFFRSYYVSGMGTIYPFSANLGLGYPANPGTVGMEERINLSADLMFYSLLIAAGLIASVGISGGAYSVKKLINTHGQFTFRGFFHGVRVAYLNTAFAVTLILVFVFCTAVVSDWCALAIANGSVPGWPIAAKVCMIVVTVLVGLYGLWLMAVGVSYKVSLWQQIKSGFVLLVGTPVHTVVFAVMAAIPLTLFILLSSLGGLWQFLATIILLLFAFSCPLLIWMSFTQWVFDMFVAPTLKAKAEKEKQAKTPQEIAAEKAEEEKAVAMQLLAAGKSELIGRPIMPIGKEPYAALPEAFTRADVIDAQNRRRELENRVAAYCDEHKNEPKYVEYQKLFAEREKALQDDGKGKKRKKKKQISAENLLR